MDLLNINSIGIRKITVFTKREYSSGLDTNVRFDLKQKIAVKFKSRLKLWEILLNHFIPSIILKVTT